MEGEGGLAMAEGSVAMKGNRRDFVLACLRGAAMLVVACLACILCLTGCSGSGDAASGDAASGGSDSDGGTATLSANTANMDFSYTDRARDASYDEASATRILLSGDAATVEGEGAAADGSTVTIAQAGTYVVSGQLDDGQIVVETPDDEKVQLVLAGASVHNETGPALYVKEADKCFVTLAEGTENTLSDGASYVLEEGEDEPNATLYSKADLCINGAGALVVDAAYQHGVNSKDDLVVTGGELSVTSVEDALRGKDCVKIDGGTFVLNAGGDGIKSNNDEDATRGFVSVTGGTFQISAGDDGVQAVTFVRLAGGDWEVDAADDAVHSDVEALIAGGTFQIAAGDDAVHAETLLTVDDGTVNVTACYEGYEAEKVVVNGGETHIVASDDGINAATADLTADAAADAGAAGGADAGADGSAAGGATSGEDAGADAGAAGAAAGAASGEDAGAGDAAGNMGGRGDMVPPDDAGAADVAGNMAVPSTDGGGGEVPADVPQGGGMMGGGPAAESPNESMLNGGIPETGVAEGGMGVSNSDCVIEINGGYTVVDAAGDGIDSNGSFSMTGGVLLVCGPTDGANGAFDYDLEATISGGTFVMVGSAGMAQNFTSGTQAFAFNTVSGQAGQNVAVADESGEVLASFTPQKAYGMVLVSSPEFEEGGTYNLVIGGTAVDANADGYADGGTVEGGTSSSFEASTTPTGGMGGLGMDGNLMAPGTPGAGAQRGGRMM